MKSPIGTTAALCAAMLVMGAASPTLQSMPASGVYRIALGRGCVRPLRTVRLATEQPYYAFTRCGDTGPAVRLTALGNGWYRISNVDGATCATIARGVVFGAARVDSLKCENAPDQRFQLELGDGLVHIKSADGRCWTGRGNVREAQGDTVMEACKARRAGGQFQWFELTAIVGPPSEEAPG